jgi:hypothetical protein
MDRIFDWVSIIGYSVQVKFLHTIGNQGELLRLPCYRHPQQNLPDHLSRCKMPEESPGLIQIPPLAKSAKKNSYGASERTNLAISQSALHTHF